MILDDTLTELGLTLVSSVSVIFRSIKSSIRKFCPRLKCTVDRALTTLVNLISQPIELRSFPLFGPQSIFLLVRIRRFYLTHSSLISLVYSLLHSRFANPHLYNVPALGCWSAKSEPIYSRPAREYKLMTRKQSPFITICLQGTWRTYNKSGEIHTPDQGNKCDIPGNSSAN